MHSTCHLKCFTLDRQQENIYKNTRHCKNILTRIKISNIRLESTSLDLEEVIGRDIYLSTYLPVSE